MERTATLGIATMGRLSDKIKVLYLTLVILFSMGVFVYLMDTWGIIRLEETFPFLKKDPPRVASSHDSPDLLEKERLRKEKERLEDLAAQLNERQKKLEQIDADLKTRENETKEKLKGIAEKLRRMKEAENSRLQQSKLIAAMADRLNSMPPDDAAAILQGWKNSDVVAVFTQMEKKAQEAGRKSIVPFLLTKLPRSRARILTSLMMDVEARRLPKRDDG